MQTTMIDTAVYLNGRVEFAALADELLAAGAQPEAQAAAELASLFPGADLLARNDLQVQPASSWRGFMFSKLRAVRDPKNPRVRQLVGIIVIKVLSIEEEERLA